MIRIRNWSTDRRYDSPRCARVALARTVAALAMLTFAFAGSARAQCPEGWVPGVGSPGTDGGVFSLAILPGGDVIVGGSFITAGGVNASGIARHNPTTGAWSALGRGTNGGVDALAVLPGGDVIAGGFFLTAGGVDANFIARFSPSTNTWSTLGAGAGGGTAGQVRALAVLPGGDVIVGGQFSSAGVVGAVEANSIARFSPSTGAWSALGSGVTGGSGVYSLVVLPGGDVIVGGDFFAAGGVAANRIARVNPSTGAWSALGSGMNNVVTSLAVLLGGDVIAGGQFSSAGGVAANRIARVNPSTGAWSALGSGTNNVVTSLAVLPGGDVIAGGQFSSAGDVPANRVARFNPSTGVWSALGSGLNSGVNALAVLPGGDVFVGGLFTAAGGPAASFIARYSFGGPAPSIGGQPSPQTVCASGSATFSVAPAGTGPFSYEWRKGNTPISTAANPSAATAVLSLANVSTADAGAYDCIITNACGSATSNAATLTVCIADTDDGTGTGTCDGGVTIDDLLFFLSAYDAGTPRADVDDGAGTGTPDGGVTIDDLLYYLTRYDAGC